MLFWLRELGYRSGWLPVVTAPLPIVSVGNLTFGGTGKTPVVQALAQHCLCKGHQPAILLRGYRRRHRGMLVVSRGQGPEVPWWTSGDEAWLHAWRLPQAFVLVDRYRERAALVAQQLGAKIAFLDDGLQYRRLSRQLELVILDRTTLRRPHVFPFGYLREPLRALHRSHVLLLNGIAPDEVPTAFRYIPWVCLRFSFGKATQWFPDKEQLLEAPPPEPVVAFAGIAQPERFRQSLVSCGWQIAFWKVFPDHHPYTLRSLRPAVEYCLRSGISSIVTTEKDFVRLRPFLPHLYAIGLTVITVSLVVEFGEGAEQLWASLEQLLQ